mmetsp:Transcript_63856/g.126346  ORF Transcript_63856/g.126346 Transcript_63856/m.126346 type:complete len:135 (+) Transcript_63856:644-1048(+)
MLVHSVPLANATSAIVYVNRLLQADLQRLDAFHAKSLRTIFNIPCSYLSRIPNKEVLRVAGQRPLSSILRDRQCNFYEKITHLPATHVFRKLTCELDSADPKRWQLARRRGRPKQQWATCVHAQIVRAGIPNEG